MTTENRKHTGSIFFALPDGTGLLHTLTGVADLPRTLGTITHDIPAKTSHVEVLTVHNWLRTPQRFSVIKEILKPDRPDPATTLKGFDYIDVPGLSDREYKLSFETFKEGNIHSKVALNNNTRNFFRNPIV